MNIRYVLAYLQPNGTETTVFSGQSRQIQTNSDIHGRKAPGESIAGNGRRKTAGENQFKTDRKNQTGLKSVDDKETGEFYP